MHYQVVDSKGEVSPARTAPFFRVKATEEPFKDYTVESIRYWFDNEYAPRNAEYTAGTSTIDVSALEDGFHTVHYQVVDSKGEVSPARTAPFFRLKATEEPFKDYTVESVRYWFDNDATTTLSAAYEDGITILDLSSMPEGVHTLCYQVITNDGQVSPVRSASIDRWIYDIYISHDTEYTDSTISSDPLFASRPDLKLHFLPNSTDIRGHLTVDEGTTLSLGKYVHTANWGSKNDANKYTKTGLDYYHPTTLLNNGFMRADSVLVKLNLYRDRWHFFSLPFNTNIEDINVPKGTYWALRRYDGEARATGLMDETWQNLHNGDQIEAGKGYIIQMTNESDEQTSWLTFKSINDTKKNNIFTTEDVTTSLQEHQAEFAHNRSWNLVGNPYPCFYDTRHLSLAGNIIVWNGNGYRAYSLTDDNYVLMPFEAFFIQKPLNADVITFNQGGRQHTNEVLQAQNSRGLFAGVLQNRRILNFMLSDEAYTDHSRVVISEHSSLGYEYDKDAPKFMEATPQTPQLFSVESGVQYAINERPMSDGQILFSLFASTDGEYRFSVEGDANNISVFDSETGSVWLLADGDYVFNATKGFHRARLLVSLNGEATAIAQVSALDDGEIKAAHGQLSFNFMRDKHVKVFSLDGRTLFNKVVNQGNISLSHGVYIVDVEGKTMKIMIK